MDDVEILQKIIEDWDGQSVPDYLMLIVQAVGVKAACGGYTSTLTIEVNDALGNLIEKMGNIIISK